MITLASSSPRRARLLEEAGIDFLKAAPDAEETREGRPGEVVIENARRKALSVIEKGSHDLVLGADTVVVCAGEILGKPEDREDARRMLLLQMEHPQEVYTGVFIFDRLKGKNRCGYEVSTVVTENDPAGVDEYLDSGLWTGKAGAYGIQDDSLLTVDIVSGEMDNVIGLPMKLLDRLLSCSGFTS